MALGTPSPLPPKLPLELRRALLLLLSMRQRLHSCQLSTSRAWQLPSSSNGRQSVTSRNSMRLS